jgi:hypothetical protein
VQKGALEFEVISADPDAVEDIRLIVSELGRNPPVRWKSRLRLEELVAARGMVSRFS